MPQEFEWELMPVMVRVEKFKDLQNKACLPPFLCYLLCPGYFGCKFLNFSTLTITGINSHSNSYNIKDSPPNPHRLGRLWRNTDERYGNYTLVVQSAGGFDGLPLLFLSVP